MHTSQLPRLLTIAGLALLLISACGEDDSGGSEPTATGSSRATPTASAAPQPAPSPSPTAVPASATATSAPAYAAQVIGTIAQVEMRGDHGSIHIVEHPDDPNSGEQYIVSIPPSTGIFERAGAAVEPLAFSDLAAGMRVVVLFGGEVADSYPGQLSAAEVVVMRMEPDEPADPQDVVTVTFVMSLFTGFSEIMPTPLDDAFYLTYTVGGEEERRHVFCGDEGQAAEECAGSGSTYEVEVDVPRGAELQYSVYRVPGDDPEREELVEFGREVVDLDLVSRSHYRFGAQNPGGYD